MKTIPCTSRKYAPRHSKIYRHSWSEIVGSINHAQQKERTDFYEQWHGNVNPELSDIVIPQLVRINAKNGYLYGALRQKMSNEKAKKILSILTKKEVNVDRFKRGEGYRIIRSNENGVLIGHFVIERSDGRNVKGHRLDGSLRSEPIELYRIPSEEKKQVIEATQVETLRLKREIEIYHQLSEAYLNFVETMGGWEKIKSYRLTLKPESLTLKEENLHTMDLEELENLNDQIRAELFQLIKEIKTPQTSAPYDCTEYMHQLETLRSELQSAHSQIEALSHQRMTDESTISNLKDQIGRFETSIEKLESAKSALKNEGVAKKAEIESQLSSAKASLKALQYEYQTLQESYDQSQREKENYNQQISGLQALLTDTQGKLTALSTKYSKQASKLHQLNTLNEDYTQAQQKIQELQKKLGHAQNLNEQEKATLNTQLKSARQDLTNVNTRLTVLQKEYETLEAQLKKAQSDLQQVHKTAEKFKDKWKKAQEEDQLDTQEKDNLREELQQTKTSLQQRIQALDAAINNMAEENQTLRNQLQEARNQLDTLNHLPDLDQLSLLPPALDSKMENEFDHEKIKKRLSDLLVTLFTNGIQNGDLEAYLSFIDKGISAYTGQNQSQFIQNCQQTLESALNDFPQYMNDATTCQVINLQYHPGKKVLYFSGKTDSKNIFNGTFSMQGFGVEWPLINPSSATISPQQLPLPIETSVTSFPDSLPDETDIASSSEPKKTGILEAFSFGAAEAHATEPPEVQMQALLDQPWSSSEAKEFYNENSVDPRISHIVSFKPRDVTEVTDGDWFKEGYIKYHEDDNPNLGHEVVHKKIKIVTYNDKKYVVELDAEGNKIISEDFEINNQGKLTFTEAAEEKYYFEQNTRFRQMDKDQVGEFFDSNYNPKRQPTRTDTLQDVIYRKTKNISSYIQDHVETNGDNKAITIHTYEKIYEDIKRDGSVLEQRDKTLEKYGPCVNIIFDPLNEANNRIINANDGQAGFLISVRVLEDGSVIPFEYDREVNYWKKSEIFYINSAGELDLKEEYKQEPAQEKIAVVQPSIVNDEAQNFTGGSTKDLELKNPENKDHLAEFELIEEEKITKGKSRKLTIDKQDFELKNQIESNIYFSTGKNRLFLNVDNWFTDAGVSFGMIKKEAGYQIHEKSENEKFKENYELIIDEENREIIVQTKTSSEVLDEKKEEIQQLLSQDAAWYYETQYVDELDGFGNTPEKKEYGMVKYFKDFETVNGEIKTFAMQFIEENFRELKAHFTPLLLKYFGPIGIRESDLKTPDTLEAKFTSLRKTEDNFVNKTLIAFQDLVFAIKENSEYREKLVGLLQKNRDNASVKSLIEYMQLAIYMKEEDEAMTQTPLSPVTSPKENTKIEVRHLPAQFKNLFQTNPEEATLLARKIVRHETENGSITEDVVKYLLQSPSRINNIVEVLMKDENFRNLLIEVIKNTEGIDMSSQYLQRIIDAFHADRIKTGQALLTAYIVKNEGRDVITSASDTNQKEAKILFETLLSDQYIHRFLKIITDNMDEQLLVGKNPATHQEIFEKPILLVLKKIFTSCEKYEFEDIFTALSTVDQSDSRAAEPDDGEPLKAEQESELSEDRYFVTYNPDKKHEYRIMIKTGINMIIKELKNRGDSRGRSLDALVTAMTERVIGIFQWLNIEPNPDFFVENMVMKEAFIKEFISFLDENFDAQGQHNIIRDQDKAHLALLKVYTRTIYHYVSDKNAFITHINDLIHNSKFKNRFQIHRKAVKDSLQEVIGNYPKNKMSSL